MTEGNENNPALSKNIMGKHISEVEFAPAPENTPHVGDTKVLSTEGHRLKVLAIARDSGDPNRTVVVCDEDTSGNNDANAEADAAAPVWTIDANKYIKGEFFEDKIFNDRHPDANPTPETAEAEPKVGEKYFHFKSPDDVYTILHIANNLEKPSERVVVYQGNYTHPQLGQNPIWVREIGDFVSYKVFDDGRQIRRFTRIG